MSVISINATINTLKGVISQTQDGAEATVYFCTNIAPCSVTAGDQINVALPIIGAQFSLGESTLSIDAVDGVSAGVYEAALSNNKVTIYQGACLIVQLTSFYDATSNSIIGNATESNYSGPLAGIAMCGFISCKCSFK